MTGALRSLLFYPTVLVGGLVLFVLRAAGVFFLLGGLLIGVFWFLGELDVSVWIVALVGAAGIAALISADLLSRLIVRVNAPGRRY